MVSDAILVQLINDYFWDNVAHRYTCGKPFLIALNKLMESNNSVYRINNLGHDVNVLLNETEVKIK